MSRYFGNQITPELGMMKREIHHREHGGTDKDKERPAAPGRRVTGPRQTKEAHQGHPDSLSDHAPGHGGYAARDGVPGTCGCGLRIGAGGTTISTRPLATSCTRPEI